MAKAKKFTPLKGHEKCCASSTIMDCLSFGNGELDQHGFWEHGCYDCARHHENQFPESGECWPFSHETLDKWKKEKELRGNG